MKKLKATFFTLLLVLSAPVAQAFTPPYHPAPGSDVYVGALTIQSTGSCKIKQAYENAVYTNNVRDNTNAFVGAGLISAEGELLAVERYTKLVSGFYRDSTGVDYKLSFYDLNSLATTVTLSTLSGCTIIKDDMITSAKSRFVWSYKTGSHDNITLDYRFNGLQPATFSLDGNNETWKRNAFSGRILFKGKRSM